MIAVQEQSMVHKLRLRNVILVYFLLFVSGSQIYNQSPNTYTILIFIMTALAWAFFSDRKIDERFILYVCLFTGFLLVIHIYTDNSLSFSSVISTTLKLLIAYLILKTVGRDFIETYVIVIVFLAVFSLLGYLSDSLLLFDGLIQKLPRVGVASYEGIFYAFRYKAHIDRNNSIFFEPGAYQMFLNAGLFMLFFANTRFTAAKKWIFISILLATLVTTFSTTGYLIFAALFGLLMLKSDVVSRQGKTALIGLLLVATVAFTAQFNAVILEKIDKFLAIQDITDTQDRRSFDALVDMEIFKRNVLGVGYKKYFQEFSVIGQVREGNASSNGITKTLAIYGFPFSLFLVGSFFAFFMKFFNGILLRFIPFSMLLIFLFSEAYYVFTPYCLALIAAIFVYEGVPKNTTNQQEITMENST